MSSTLNVTKQLSNDRWVITATISPDGTLPQEIFVYENTGTTSLGDYAGVIAAVDMVRVQIWQGIAIPAFGNKFVRHDTGIIYVTGTDDPDTVINGLKTSVQKLSNDYQAVQTSSQVYTIT